MARQDNAVNSFVRRIRALREERWSDLVITQAQLAQALGVEKSISVPLVSSWESFRSPKIPPASRLEAYATFFATKRSVEHEPFRMLEISELTEQERAQRERLLRELIELRNAAIAEIRVFDDSSESTEESLWYFSDGLPITIVCARLPEWMREKMPYTDPASPDYVEIYNYADPDSLIELYSHLRVINPKNQVTFRLASQLGKNDYANHLVVLGGVDWNSLTRDVWQRVRFPVRQIPHEGQVPGEPGAEVSFFELEESSEQEVFRPRLNSQGMLLEDIALFYRGPNPYNLDATITMFNGAFARGTLGAVRAVTDPQFREKNEEYLRSLADGNPAFGILTRVSLVNGQVVTPNWVVPTSRLYEWSRAQI